MRIMNSEGTDVVAVLEVVGARSVLRTVAGEIAFGSDAFVGGGGVAGLAGVEEVARPALGPRRLAAVLAEFDADFAGFGHRLPA